MPNDPRARYTVVAPGPVHGHEIDIKKSRFLALLTRVTDEDSAREFIAGTRGRYRDARHHCSAFLLGPGRETGRSSDDGEPAGTAGIPMLQTLTAFKTPLQRDRGATGDLSDVCAVVVRWFGGVKLGAAGLVRAYSGAVAEALATAPLRTRMRAREISVRLPHALAGRIEDDVRTQGFTLLATDYRPDAAVLRLIVADDAASVGHAVQAVTALTSGAHVPEPGAVSWQDMALR